MVQHEGKQSIHDGNETLGTSRRSSAAACAVRHDSLLLSGQVKRFGNCLTESFEPAACEAICAKAAGCACLEYTPDPQAGGGRHRCKIYTGVTALKTFARHDAYVLSSNDGHAAEAFEPAEYTDDETEVTCHDTAQPSGLHSSRSASNIDMAADRCGAQSSGPTTTATTPGCG